MQNCGFGAYRVIYYLMGSPLYEAPASCEGMSAAEFNSLIGGTPVGPINSAQLQIQLNQLPKGAVGALTINPGGDIGHVVAVAKAPNGRILFPDPQLGAPIPLSEITNPNYTYTLNIIGNGLLH
jgi:hypothetical protein